MKLLGFVAVHLAWRASRHLFEAQLLVRLRTCRGDIGFGCGKAEVRFLSHWLLEQMDYTRSLGWFWGMKATFCGIKMISQDVKMFRVACCLRFWVQVKNGKARLSSNHRPIPSSIVLRKQFWNHTGSALKAPRHMEDHAKNMQKIYVNRQIVESKWAMASLCNKLEAMACHGPHGPALRNGGTAPDIKSPGGCLDCIVTATWAFSSTTSNCGKVTCFGAHLHILSDMGMSTPSHAWGTNISNPCTIFLRHQHFC